MGMKGNTTTGVCRFCGQTVIFEAPEGLENLEAHEVDTALSDMATRNCTCEDGKRFGERMAAKDNAEATISKLFADQLAPMGRILLAALDDVAFGRIDNVTVKKTGSVDTTGKIRLNKDFCVVVDRKDTTTTSSTVPSPV